MRLSRLAAGAALAGACLAGPQVPGVEDPKQLASVSGVVLTTSGTPVADASVSLYPREPAPASGPRPRYQTVSTDASGKFALEKIAPGTYGFGVSHNAYEIPRTTTEALGPLPPSRLTLVAGQRLDGLTFRLLEPATIGGRTVDEDGDPVWRADIQLLQRQYSEGRRTLRSVSLAITGADGDFKITGVKPGRYILVAEKQPVFAREPAYSGFFGARPPRAAEIPRAPIPAHKPGATSYSPGLTYYGGSNSDADATVIDVSPGQNIRLGDIRMENRPLVHVRGKVVGDPAALARARVTTASAGGGYRWNYGADIERDGSFDLANVTPGNDVRIFVVGQGSSYLTWTRLEVGREGVGGLILNARPAPITGTVRFEGEERPPDMGGKPLKVFVGSSGGANIYREFSGAVNPDGSFAIESVAPGIHWVGASLPEGSYVKSVRLNGRELPDQQIEWGGSDGGALELIVSRDAAVLEGTLLDEDGKPVSGTVTLVPGSERPLHRAWYPETDADAKGSFRFSTVPPGTYKIYGWEEIEYTAHWNPDYIRPFESRGLAVELQQNGRSGVTVKRISAAAADEALRKAGVR